VVSELTRAQLSRRAFGKGSAALLLSGLSGWWPGRSDAGEPCRVPANGFVFDVRIEGPDAGRPVLLLHGFPQNAQTWAPVTEALAAAGCRAIAPDLRGYSPGARPAAAAEYTFAQFRADVLGIADALRLERFDLCGVGMGAALSWIIAATAPERVRSLTALRYPHPAAFAQALQSDAGQQEAWRQLEQGLNPGAVESSEARAALMLENDAARLRSFLQDSGLPKDATELYVERMQEPGALAAALRWQRAAGPAEFVAVPPVSVPTLFIWSEGPALTATTARATSRYVTGLYEEQFLEGAGHFLLETAAVDRVIALLLQHLGRT
jgi:pimeloyl-ACP methyl ester carboxylesterase